MEKCCSECGHYPRRLSMKMEGLLFCQRDCYLAYSARKWERQFSEKFGGKAKTQPQVLALRKEIRTA